MNGFQGRTALVTGASRGTGYATALALGRLGANVVISARSGRRLDDSARKLAAEGIAVASIAGDVARPEDAEAMVALALERFGRLDIVVNNAGVSMRGRLDELSVETCRQVLDSNLLGSILVSRAAVESLKQSGGSLVFISSIAGLLGLPGASPYCAAKGALTGFAESLRLELAAWKVHVGVVHLGFTEHDPEKRILAADGSPVLPDRPAHQTQAGAAADIVRMIRRRRRRVVLTPVGKLAAFAYRLSPTFVERAIRAAQESNWAIFRNFS